MKDDIERLVRHAAIMGVDWPTTGDLCDMKNQSWRSLPDHLTKLIIEEEDVVRDTFDLP